MKKQDVFNKVKAIIVDLLGVHEDEVTNDAQFIDDLGADSLDFVEIIMKLEEEFNITIDDEKMVHIKTIEQAVDMLMEII